MAAVLQSSEGSTLRANAGDGERFGSAVQAGLDRNYAPMAEVFSAVIARTLRLQATPSSS
jgi:hypothetical protein